MIYTDIWQKVLSEKEKVLYEFSVSGNYSKTYLIIWGVISVPLLFIFGLGLITFIVALIYYGFYLKKSNAYAFTNKRILVHKGLLSTNTISVDYNKITDVTISEKFFDKILTKTGSLFINTAGTTFQEIVLTHIDKPYQVKKKLDEIRK